MFSSVRRLRFAALIGATWLCIGLTAVGADAAKPFSPAEAAQHVKLPDGFKTTMFASEPELRQPIAMTFDDRGRLWVAECNTYSNAKTNFDLHLHDRILIFEDSSGSGHFDKCKVFWDRPTAHESRGWFRRCLC